MNRELVEALVKAHGFTGHWGERTAAEIRDMPYITDEEEDGNELHASL